MIDSTFFIYGTAGLFGVGWAAAIFLFIAKWMRVGSFFTAYTIVDRQFPVYPRYRTIARLLDIVNTRQAATREELLKILEIVEAISNGGEADMSESISQIKAEIEEILRNSGPMAPEDVVLRLVKN